MECSGIKPSHYSPRLFIPWDGPHCVLVQFPYAPVIHSPGRAAHLPYCSMQCAACDARHAMQCFTIALHSIKAAQIQIIISYSKASARTTVKSSTTSVYAVVTDQIIAFLEQGLIPWRKPWSTLPAQNLVSTTSTGVSTACCSMIS
jgi:hypothetical protein